MPVSSSDSSMSDETNTGMNTKLLAFVCVSCNQCIILAYILNCIYLIKFIFVILVLKKRNKTMMDSKSTKAKNVKDIMPVSSSSDSSMSEDASETDTGMHTKLLKFVCGSCN